MPRDRDLRLAELTFVERLRRLNALQVVAAALAMSAACADAGPAEPTTTGPAITQAQNGLVMHLNEGAVRGTLTSETRSFIGVPYAAPPLGKLRWQPPHAVDPRKDTFDATGPGVACPQPGQTDGIAVTQSEDCLSLNVFAPAKPPSELLPVMVWLHGGGNTTGSANLEVTSDPVLSSKPAPRRLYDGIVFREYAEREAVVVTVNYRLGTLGFLAHPGLTAEGHGASGNYGLMDQQAALRWVHENIAAFGGDPERVTLIGQGAGATDICYHLLADDSRGLFHAAVLQSGSCGTQPEAPLAEAEDKGAKLATELGCSDQKGEAAVECLRGLPASELVTDVDAEELIRRELDAQVVVDGRVLRQDAASAFESGDFATVPLIIGNDDRCARRPCSEAEAKRNEQLFVCPARELARRTSQRARVFLYSLTRSAAFAPSPEEWTNIISGSEQLWAWNIWPTLSPYAADDGNLSLQMRGYWEQLIDGDVNIDASKQRWARPDWPAYNADHETELLLDLTIQAVVHHRSARCE